MDSHVYGCDEVERTNVRRSRDTGLRSVVDVQRRSGDAAAGPHDGAVSKVGRSASLRSIRYPTRCVLTRLIAGIRRTLRVQPSKPCLLHANAHGRNSSTKSLRRGPQQNGCAILVVRQPVSWIAPEATIRRLPKGNPAEVPPLVHSARPCLPIERVGRRWP